MMVKEKVQNVKNHVIRHKTFYISCTVGIVSAGFTYSIMRGRHAGMQSVPDTAEQSVFVRTLNFFSRNQNNIGDTIVTVIERDGRGHPGYLVRCIETGEVYSSQKQVAKAYGRPDSVLSLHMRGKRQDFAGHHF